MQIVNITGYKFITLSEVERLRKNFFVLCKNLTLKGTILLSDEGINLSLAGSPENIQRFKMYLKKDVRFDHFSFQETHSTNYPFKRLKVKIKKEIITLRQTQTNPTVERAPTITPQALKKWLDENKNMILLDVRNQYEIQFGTFVGAVHLHLKNFSEFVTAIEKIAKEKTIITFCTGGIRCEKAALFMLQHGFENVFQLEGGILNYFNKIGKAHYKGQCFVFDERIALTPETKHAN